MAKEEKDSEENSNTAAAGGFLAGKKKIILLAVLGLVLIAVSIGGTLLALSLLSDKEPMVDQAAVPEGEAAAAAAPAVVQKPIYYPIKPAILVSFDARGRQRLLQAEITLMTRDNDVVAALELHMPMIRNALITVISGQTYEEIQSAEGKELLRVQCLQELQTLLQKEIGKPGLEQVLFTSLVLQ